MLSIPSKRRTSLLRISFLFFFLVADGVSTRNEGIEITAKRRRIERNQQNIKRQHNLSRKEQRERELNQRNNNRYYELFDSSQSNSKTTLLDVWLCLACALGWSIWLISSKQPPQELVFEQQESAKAMGHVLQVSLGEDSLGTGIPVYYAVVDFVAQGASDEEHIQVRKVFTSKSLLEEGFANVEVMYLVDDPTTAVLMEDFLDQKRNGEFEAPPTNEYSVAIYILSLLLIGFSLFGGVRMANHLETPLYGYISLGLGVLLLFPSAKVLYRVVTHLYGLAGPLTDRPGIIVHGKRLYWKNQCHATLNPMEILGVEKDNSLSTVLELSDLPPSTGNSTGKVRLYQAETPKMFPNAGCGSGNFNVHLPTERFRTHSSLSSIGNSTSQNLEKSSSSRSETSILQGYQKFEEKEHLRPADS